jgi:hypothetical protein
MSTSFVRYVIATGEILSVCSGPDSALTEVEDAGIARLQIVDSATVFTNTHQVVDGEVVPL